MMLANSAATGSAPAVEDSSPVVGAYRQHLSAGLARLHQMMGPLHEVSAQGPYVTCSDGRRYLDCSGYGVFLLGHNHPAVVDAVIRQIRKRALATRVLLDPVLAGAAERLAAVSPGGQDQLHFTGGGAEAVEHAIKIALSAGHQRLVAMQDSYHGKSLGALSVTGRPHLKKLFGPLLDVQFVPFGELCALEKALDGQPPSTVIVEPVLGEGGVVCPPEGFLRSVRATADLHGALVIADEVQTGLGRTGRIWAGEDLVADIVVTGKILGGGVVPVGAVLTAGRLNGAFNADPMLGASTFAGSPLQAAAVVAALDVIEQEDIVHRAYDIGRRVLAALRACAADAAGVVREVRGAGLLLGLEMEDHEAAGTFWLEMRRHGVLAIPASYHSTVVRLTPAAVMSEADEIWLCDAVQASLRVAGRSLR